ncbi:MULTISPECIES: ATP-binding protein [unclassified Duganella]|uniref:ATP-binding protein n=1 Tax=unclassified Duganella TaxID=2636909 RepID=UPI000877C302|nr:MULTISPECIES: ATP-binding protein [unclassified Duganella]
MMHPLFKQNTALVTPSIKELYLNVKRRIILREMSVAILAPSGAGKSMALSMLHAFIAAEFPGILVLIHNAHNQQYTSIRAFFKHFLATVGHKEQRGETFDLRQRLLHILVDDARVEGRNIIVLMIDEANAMKLDDFLFLKDVGNDLAEESIQLITILMGQSPELDMVLDELAYSRRLDLLARFGLRRLEMRECNSASDLKAIFTAIDTEQYPTELGAPWTAYFIPKAFKAGFRLVQQVENCDRALKKLLRYKGRSRASFPTRQLFVAIRIFLLNMASIDSEDFVVPADAWKVSIAEALVKQASDLADRRSSSDRVKGQ